MGSQKSFVIDSIVKLISEVDGSSASGVLADEVKDMSQIDFSSFDFSRHNEDVHEVGGYVSHGVALDNDNYQVTLSEFQDKIARHFYGSEDDSFVK